MSNIGIEAHNVIAVTATADHSDKAESNTAWLELVITARGRFGHKPPTERLTVTLFMDRDYADVLAAAINSANAAVKLAQEAESWSA